MKQILCLLILAITATLIEAQGERFTCFYEASEVFSGGSRDFRGRLYYQRNWNGASFGRDRLKYVIELQSGQIVKNLQELTIWEDQFFRFTICEGQCAWQDIFADIPMPFWVFTQSPPSDVALTSTENSEDVQGTLSEEFDVVMQNSVDVAYSDKVWFAEQGSPRWPTKATVTYNQGTAEEVVRTVTMTQHSASFDDVELDIPSNCPDIEPGCFRLDLMFVVDLSGSVGDQVSTEFDFVLELTDNFVIDAKHFACGLSSFRDCANTALREPLTYDKATWLTNVGLLKAEMAGGWTCIVGGVQRAFDSIRDHGRPATSRALIVITDGNGNRPCCSDNIQQFPTANCRTPNIAPTGVPSSCAGTNSPCNDQNPPFYPCCPAFHDWQLKDFYDTFYAVPPYNEPTIFAIGVGNVALDTLTQIVYDTDVIAAGEPRRFQVSDFSQLNTLIAVIVAAILCDVPGSQECPNDCLPDGFCCAGGCICSVDCNDISTECQAGFCQVNAFGASCTLDEGQDSICQNNVAFQCRAVFCADNGTCVGVIQDDLGCDDGNLCTNSFCENGVCISERNYGISDCTDFNGCTEGDLCDEDGVCIPGTPNDFGDCTDNNNCTADSCSGGECVSVLVVECEDKKKTDCIVPECNPASGLCRNIAVEEGAICRPSPQGDNCTVYVCEDFDKDTYDSCAAVSPVDDEGNVDDSDCEKGRCVKRRLDKSECESSTDNTGAIIGGVIAGIVFIAILILLLVIFLLILFRKPLVGALGNLAGFGNEATVTTSPTYVTPATDQTNRAYVDQ